MADASPITVLEIQSGKKFRPGRLALGLDVFNSNLGVIKALLKEEVLS